MPTPTDQINTYLQNLEKLVGNPRLPEKQQTFHECYKKILNLLISKYRATGNEKDQMLHFSAIYAITRLHSADIAISLGTRTSVGLGGAVSYYFKPTPEQLYFKELLKCQNEITPVFDDVAKKYIKNTSNYVQTQGHGENLKYVLGTEMTDENTGPSQSLLQLEKRVYVFTYFEKLHQSLDSTILKTDALSVSVVGSFLLLYPPMVLPAVVASLVLAPTIKEPVKQVDRSLSRIDFQNDFKMAAWYTEAQDLLSKLHCMNDFLARVEPSSTTRPTM